MPRVHFAEDFNKTIEVIMNPEPTLIPIGTSSKANKITLTKSEILLLKISNHIILSGRREVPKELVDQIQDVAQDIRFRK